MVASVVATAGQVLYLGVDNPVTVTVPGVAPADLVVNTKCAFSGAAGQYLVRPTEGTGCIIAVGVKRDGAVVWSAEGVSLAVQPLPDPVVYAGNIKGDGGMTRAEVQGLSGLVARLERFPIDAKFAVKSFVMAMNINGAYVDQAGSGPGLTPMMRTMLSGAGVGTRVIFERVTVEGPDGALRSVPGVVLKVK